MKSISIESRKGLKIASAMGNAIVQINNKPVFGKESITKSLSLLLGTPDIIKFDGLVITPEIEEKVVAFYDSNMPESWTRYLDDKQKRDYYAKVESLRNLIANYKGVAKRNAIAKVEAEFAA